ncbi:MAG TPA: M1 family metallopeptidase [Puia sp.]|nr:M1 family metallopeptidase [Puia sp.]
MKINKDPLPLGKALLIVVCLSVAHFSQAQLMQKKEVFTHADTLRGTLNSNRDWWDVQRYDIRVRPDFDAKTIGGSVTIGFKALTNGEKMQLDFQQPMIIDSIPGARFERDGNIALVSLGQSAKKGDSRELTVYFHGKPREAVTPPWDGGWIWKKDKEGRAWMSVACQGLGASVWFPCKDHQSDEPDNGAGLTIIVPDSTMAVGNGRLKSSKKENGLTAYTWEVTSPINSYCIIPYIGQYANFSDTLMGEKGKLDLGYWVLDYDLEKAKEQFKQAKLMLRAFEYWLGPYPFYEDGYKLVESPHLGMEHQSATAYGNRFQNGYLGRDMSGSGWGMKWDYIIVHESAHEWFANSITTKDIADMWVHEGFANYAEVLYTEYYYGKEAGTDYCVGIRRGIRNQDPIIGHYGVNKEGSGDMYPKGANLLHSIRHAINDDEKFRQILRGLSSTFYHQTVTTRQIEDFISSRSGIDLSKVFDQYLRNTQIPVLEYYPDDAAGRVSYRWTNCIPGFNLPLVLAGGDPVHPTTEWQTTPVGKGGLDQWKPAAIERLYYVKTSKLSSKPS